MIRPVVYSAVTTAFHEDGTLDLPGTTRLFSHALAGGVDAVFVNGTTAEFAALTISERRDLLAAAVSVAGPERVVAHVGAASPYHAGALTADARALGITKLSVLTPFYMPSTVDGVRDQVAAAKAEAGGAEIFLYLFPDRTGVQMPAADAARVIEEFDLAGAKISIAGTEYLADLVGALSSPRVVLSGNDGLLREVIAAGGHGIVSGVSSSVPAPFVALADAIAAGDTAEQDRLAARINEIVPVLGPSIAALKISQREQGLIASAACRMAIDPPDAEWLARIARVLADHPSPTTTRVS
jgi:4-hydroxy-tetrahydrodipicolinate synthase